MQDIHSIGGGGGGGGGRLFAVGGGDRRLRPHHQHQHPHHQNHQALKCPRCDSLNTKFCYYNNYNLSQPRHFCKNCRRYWTKGGVLRNVPVGGGCRKTKRSKPKQTSAPDATETATATATTPTTPQPAPVLQERQRERRSSNSHSSSESSSLTVTNTTATVKNTAAEAVSSTNNPLTRVGESDKLFDHVNMGSSFEPAGLMEQGSAAAAADCAIFSEIGSFTSLITSTHDMSFGFNDMLSQQNLEAPHGNNNNSAGDNNNQQWGQQQQQQQQGMKFEEMGGGPLMDDQTVQVDQLNGSRGFGGLDWQGGGGGDHHQDLFDIPNGVDHGYWSHSQWSDHEDHPSLYLP